MPWVPRADAVTSPTQTSTFSSTPTSGLLTTPTTPQPSGDSSGDISSGTAAGTGVGSAVGALFIAGVVFLAYRLGRRSRRGPQGLYMSGLMEESKPVASVLPIGS